MTITHRKRPLPEETQVVVNEPGLHVECDGCHCDLTHSVRIKCADPICDSGEGVDICPQCYTQGMEFGQHRRTHPYRVIELHSYPIFDEEWGADEELLLNEGLTLQGLGNWTAVAEHVGTRTKEEIERHYNSVYIDSPNYPLPRMDQSFHVATSEFQSRKRRRLESLSSAVSAAVVPKAAPTSTPGVHEIGTYLPGRLEFEHEMDNDAEDTVKDLEFGLVMDFGGDEVPEDENDHDVKTRKRWEETRKDYHKGKRKRSDSLSGSPPLAGKPMVNGINGHSHSVANGYVKLKSKPEDGNTKDPPEPGAGTEGEANADEAAAPLLPMETAESMQFKFSLLETYRQRVAKRHEAKTLIFERGLLEYKKMQAADKKRPKEEREFVHKFRPYAKLQTAQDYEDFINGMLYESMLRRRIQELQHYRRLGLTSSADVEKYESDLYQRIARTIFIDKAQDRLSRQILWATVNHPKEDEVEIQKLSPKPVIQAASQPEQMLCSQLRILPKAYLVIKDVLVREFARRGGKLRRREARELVKIDVNKTSRVWDFLVQAGVLRIPDEPPINGPSSNGVPPPGSITQATSSPTKIPAAALQSDQPLDAKESNPPAAPSAIPLPAKKPLSSSSHTPG